MTRRSVAALAALGAVFLVVQVWGYVGWLLSDEFVEHDSPEPIPAAVATAVERGQLVQVVGAALWLVLLVVLTFRKRALTWPLVLTIVWSTVYWQDPLVNLVDPVFSYNAGFFDRGDWTAYLPFVPDDAPGLDQPLLMQALVFVWFIPAVSAAAYGVMRLVSRWTTRSVVLVLVAWAAIAVFETLFELKGIDQGLLAWRQAAPELSLRAGTPDQWPFYEGVLLGLLWALPGIVLFFRDRLPVARGDGVSLVVGLLAASGALNAAFLAYNVALIVLAGDPVELDPWLS